MQLLNPDDDESGIQAMEELYQKDPYLKIEHIGQLMNYYPTRINKGPSLNTSVRNEYIKLGVQKSGTMLIGNYVYNQLKNKIEKFYGCPVSDIKCTSITIRPNDKVTTHYYFQLEREPMPSRISMRLVGWIQCFDPNYKLQVNCPFSDSMYSRVFPDGHPHIMLPWYDNSGKEIVPEYFDSDAIAPEGNMIIPFLGKDVNFGMYMFTGIHDTVGFQCTVLVNKELQREAIANEQFRRTNVQQSTPWKRSHKRTPKSKIIRKEHVPKYIMQNTKTGIGYEIPSQDIEYYEGEDPLLKAFQ